MTDIESRLRAAMQTMLTEPRPTGTLAGVRRRHRRHLARVAAACTAALLAIAAGAQPAANALRSTAANTAPGRSGHHRPAPPKPASVPSAAPGTVLSGCSMANPGPALPDFQRGAVRAGPLYFTPGDAAVSRKARAGQVAGPPKLYVVVVVISGLSPGKTVAVTAAPAYRRYIRFLFGPNDSLNPGTTYTMASGEAGVTFVACSRETGYTNQSVTDYYGGFLISGNRCVPVDVRLARRPGPIIARLGACR